jgi:hypothetical protein
MELGADRGEDELMCEAEEVLNWLIDEVATKSKEADKCRRALYDAMPWGSFDQDSEISDAFDSVGDLGSELRALVREAKQRLKESKRQVAA